MQHSNPSRRSPNNKEKHESSVNTSLLENLSIPRPIRIMGAFGTWFDKAVHLSSHSNSPENKSFDDWSKDEYQLISLRCPFGRVENYSFSVAMNT